jgi:hypothetical protein
MTCISFSVIARIRLLSHSLAACIDMATASFNSQQNIAVHVRNLLRLIDLDKDPDGLKPSLVDYKAEVTINKKCVSFKRLFTRQARGE